MTKPRFWSQRQKIDSILSALGRFLVDSPVELLGEVSVAV